MIGTTALIVASLTAVAEDPQIVGAACQDSGSCPYLFVCESAGDAKKCAYHAAHCTDDPGCVDGFMCMGKHHCTDDVCEIEAGLCIPAQTPCATDASCKSGWTCTGTPIDGPGEGEAFYCLPPGWNTLADIVGSHGEGADIAEPHAVTPVAEPPEADVVKAADVGTVASGSSGGCAAGGGSHGGCLLLLLAVFTQLTCWKRSCTNR